MSKKNIGIILLIVGLLLFLNNFPFTFNFPYQELLWPLALTAFGIYLMNKKNYQVGLVIFYLGLTYSLYHIGWKPMALFINKQYYWPTVIMVLGLGFILQSQRGR